VIRVLDLYCGMGGLSLGFALGIENAEILGLDIDRYAVSTYNMNLNRYGCRAVVQDVLKWEPNVEYDLVIGGVPCFLPETMVVTTSGLKEIKDMKENDMVLTHRGRLKKVTKVMCRYYKGKLVKLRLSLLRIPILVTPDHPFFVLKTRPCSLGINMPCTPTCSHKGESRNVIHYRNYGRGMYEYVRECKRYYDKYKPEWVEAEQLEPRRTFVIVTLPKGIKPPSNIPLEWGWWYIFGLYVAEGTPYVKYVYKNKRDKGKNIKRVSYMVYFSLGKHETDLINKLVRVLRRLGFNPRVREHTRNTIRVVVYSKKLYELVFSIFGKYAKGKRIPIWVLNLPKECREAFLEGVRDGDGDKEKYVTTVNPNIAFMVWLLALSLGRPASLSRVRMRDKKEIEGRIMNQSPYLYKVREIKRQSYERVGRYWFQGDHIVLEVLYKEYIDYDGVVYNLEVEEDNSYEVWGITVHNCQPYSLANTKKRGKDHPLYPTLPRFFDIVLELEPKAFLMENVKGLVMRRHIHLLEEQLDRVRGEYRIAWRVLNSAYYGVPQRRERVFVLGIRKDLGIKPSFPTPTHAEEERVTLEGKLYKWVTVREAIGDLLLIPPLNYPKKLIQTNPRHGKPIDINKPSRVVKVDGRGGDFTFDTILVPLTPEQVERIIRERMDTVRHRAPMEFPDPLDKPSRTVSSHTVEGTKRETIVIPITEHVMTEKGGWSNPRSDWGSRVMPEDRPSFTITSKHMSGQLVEIPSAEWPSNTIASNTGKNVKWAHNSIIVQGKYRRLMVRECMRLQSFPDWWSFPSNISISRKYKLVGEAVPPIMAYRLAVHIGKLLGLRTRDPNPKDFDFPYFNRSFPDISSY